ncbi:MAG: hypothetical protein EXQ58_09075 [Acidobacteria bacterium]|nr:hypothetical protein [Acidobacteriota bacterium]
MRRFIWLPCLLAGSLLLGAPEKETNKSVTGWVLDSACAFTKGLTKPISRECAVACAKKASPLVILQDDGTIYWPISESMPAAGQNVRLMPFAGKRVTATGKEFTRGGSRALVIEKIAEAPTTK